MQNKANLFNFFNYRIKIESNDEKLLGQIAYIYRDYLIQDDHKFDYYFFLKNNTDYNFILSEIMGNKGLQVLHGSNEKTLNVWDDENTFLPPITAPYFRSYFSFYHGSAIRYKDKTIAFFGPSRSGKTTLMIEALDKGANLISDDIIIFDNKTAKIFPFKKPIGLRNTTSFFLEERFRKVASEIPKYVPVFNIQQQNLVTELIHITDIPGWSYFETPTTIDEVYFINPDGNNEEVTSVYDFIEKINEQACIANESLKIIIEIYKKLQCKPHIINIRNRNFIWETLN